MCGIFGYFGRKRSDLGNLILDGLRKLEYRGYDSWGLLVKNKESGFFLRKNIGKISDAKVVYLDSSAGIGHTRWATHGGVSKKNSHPHLDCRGKIAVVHNGIVENFQELKKYLKKLGHKFHSDTDSEVIAHLLEEEIERKLPLQAMKSVFSKIKGLNAIIAYLIDKDCFLLAKNSSPVIIGRKDRDFFIASDVLALSGLCDEVFYMGDDQIAEIGKKGLKVVSSKGEEIQPKFKPIRISEFDISLAGFNSFMEKEINQQPEVILNILEKKFDSLQRLAEMIKSAYGSYFIGCGTAYYAALAGTYLFSKIAGHHINAAFGSEFAYLLDFIKKDSLVIALSQSGETIDVINPVKQVRKKGSKVAAITNVYGSSLYRNSDFQILLDAGVERCVLATKSFTAKIAVLYLAAHIMAGSFDKGRANLLKAVSELKKIIMNADRIRRLAGTFAKHKHIFILGRGISYPLALESALKIKEASYIHAEGFAAGELKHGVIALIEKGIPVIVYNPADETYRDTLSSAFEIKSRGAYVIGISSLENDVYDEFIKVEDCGDAGVIPSVAAAQLIGLYLAERKGYDPDKPRNLAKSVTVK